MKFTTDTIAAIATPFGNGSIGVIRLSGPDVFTIADAVFIPGNKKTGSLGNVKTHTVHHGHIFSGERVIDEVLVTVFHSPRSYTTEDVLEISCHGGTAIMQQVLDTVLQAGARLSKGIWTSPDASWVPPAQSPAAPALSARVESRYWSSRRPISSNGMRWKSGILS